MLKPHKSLSLLLQNKPFIHGSKGSRASLSVWSASHSFPNKHKNLRVVSVKTYSNNIEAVSSTNSTNSSSSTSTSSSGSTTTTTITTTTEVTEIVTENEDAVADREVVTTKEVVTEKFISVKATITVTLTVGGFLSHMGIARGLDDIKDVLGRTLFMELLSAHLDPNFSLKKLTTSN